MPSLKPGTTPPILVNHPLPGHHSSRFGRLPDPHAPGRPPLPVVPRQEVFQGRRVLVGILNGPVVGRELVCRDGFDFGKTLARDEETGETFTLLVQNENLAVQNGAGELVLTAPDSVAMLALERGEGVTNAELREGMPLAVLGIKAAEPWYRIPAGFDCWDEVFRNVGLGEDVEHVAF